MTTEDEPQSLLTAKEAERQSTGCQRFRNGDLEAAESPAGKPQFLLSAEEEAERRGLTWKQVLEEDLEAARASAYPSPECLLPAEIERFFDDGFLAAGRAEHAAGCASCSSLLASAGADPAEIERILSEVKNRRREPAAAAGRRGSGRESHRARWPSLVGLGTLTLVLGYEVIRRLMGWRYRQAPEPDRIREQSFKRVKV